MGGDLFALLDDPGDGRDHRHAARRGRARTAGAAADDEFVAVALQQADAVEGNAEPARQNLRERRRVALAVVERAGDEGHGAVRFEADAAHLLVGWRGDFEIAADRDAAQPAALLALALAFSKAFPVGKF